MTDSHLNDEQLQLMVDGIHQDDTIMQHFANCTACKLQAGAYKAIAAGIGQQEIPQLQLDLSVVVPTARPKPYRYQLVGVIIFFLLVSVVAAFVLFAESTTISIYVWLAGVLIGAALLAGQLLDAAGRYSVAATALDLNLLQPNHSLPV